MKNQNEQGEEAARDLAQALRRKADLLDLILDAGHEVDAEDMRAVMVQLLDKLQTALDKTPTGRIETLRERARSRRAWKAVAMASFAVLLFAITGAVVGIVRVDPWAVAGWAAVFLSMGQVNRMALRRSKPGNPWDDGELALLVARRESEPCPECGHTGHLPGCCGFGLTAHSEHHGDLSYRCKCSLGVPPEVDNTSPCA